MYKSFEELGVPLYTIRSWALQMPWLGHMPGSDGIPGIAAENDPVLAEQVKALQEKAGHAMNAFLAPLYQGAALLRAPQMWEM